MQHRDKAVTARYVTDAQRRMDTGWELKDAGNGWWLRRRMADGHIQVRGWYDTESEARAAYLAVTASGKPAPDPEG
jgi:hypothetical protein